MAGEMSKGAAKAAGAAKGAMKALSGQSGIFHHLAGEHGEVATLMGRIAGSKDDSKVRDDLFPKMRKNLLAHAKSEEAVFYPEMRKFPQLEPLVAKSIQQHKEVETMLEELNRSDRHTSAWLSTFERMKAAVETHVKLEEKEMFEKADELIDREHSKRLLERYEATEKTEKARIT